MTKSIKAKGNSQKKKIMKMVNGKMVQLDGKISKISPKLRILACKAQKCKKVEPQKKEACRQACIKKYGALIKEAPKEKVAPLPKKKVVVKLRV